MYIQSTRDTHSNVYQDAVAIRFKVFVQGQGVPSAIEIDQNESHCIYFVLYNEAHQAVATVRLLPDSESNQVTLQRMAVFDDYQGKGIGSLLLQEAEKVAQEQSFHSISLHDLSLQKKRSWDKSPSLFLSLDYRQDAVVEWALLR